MSDLHDIVKIDDPYFYVNDPFPVFARIRVEEPLFYDESLDTYVLTRYADCKHVVSTPALFTSTKGLNLNDIRYQAAGRPMTVNSFFPPDSEPIGTLDPPRHTELRRVISPAFAGRVVSGMEAPIRAGVQEVLDQIRPGEVTDWVDLVGNLPVRVGAHIVGLTDADEGQLRRWSDALGQIGGDLSLEELDEARREVSGLESYILSSFEGKRSHPGDDVLTVLLRAELDNERLSEANVLMFTMMLLAAGPDNTRALLAGLVWALANNPDQLAKVREDRSLVANSVEEALRWVSPARGFMRTATQDLAIGDQKVRAGQHLYSLFMAGNRDPGVFPNPETFDVTRKENNLQIAFGFGGRACIGAPLVRLETRILLDVLLDRFGTIEPAGTPTPMVHLIRNSWTDMPVIFGP